MILGETTPAAELRATVFALVRRDVFTDAVERVSQLAEPEGDIFLTEHFRSPGRLRYAPALLRSLLTAEIREKQARSIKYQTTMAKHPLAKEIEGVDFADTLIN